MAANAPDNLTASSEMVDASQDGMEVLIAMLLAAKCASFRQLLSSSRQTGVVGTLVIVLLVS